VELRDLTKVFGPAVSDRDRLAPLVGRLQLPIAACTPGHWKFDRASRFPDAVRQNGRFILRGGICC